jgi:hypothetical protein
MTLLYFYMGAHVNDIFLSYTMPQARIAAHVYGQHNAPDMAVRARCLRDMSVESCERRA